MKTRIFVYGTKRVLRDGLKEAFPNLPDKEIETYLIECSS